MKQVVLGAGVAFAVGVVLIAGGSHLERGVPMWVLVVPLAFTCAGVLVRQRAPLASLGLGVVGIVIDGFVGPSLGTVLVFTDNLYAAALYGPARFARVLLGIAGVLAVVAGAVAGFLYEDWRMLAVMGVQAGLVLITPVTTAVVLREQRDRAAAERVRAEQVARLAELDRQAAVAAERTRMARELHDMIANHFSAIAIQSTAALSRKDLDRETVRKVMESVRENSVKGMAEMRAMIGLLRQEGDEGESEATRPRLADAQALVERVRRAGMAVETRVEGEVRELPAAVDLAGYRILQEALTNALKHGASPVSVAVVYEDGRVRLSVENALGDEEREIGLPGAGAGLIGMRERVSLVGGAFDAGEVWEGEPGGGGRWRVVAVLPMEVDVTRPGLSGGEGEGVERAPISS
ncbi:sensor histidine kinase [Nonomuraea gerenzanensis]|uniref:histidine kinase n=1 Tax=Nonomuraea gerenzanensis TaxID=93944 RepID=A0A1M4DXK5_9ACTN|nr:histidine kinase [Nonomuraea gerenzanensis]UBU13651.1 histidine kinase [Nonomuraea gerenzanensis]SBO91317.1 two-component system sensor kinase [Nonomuraea gerenzanensis]